MKHIKSIAILVVLLFGLTIVLESCGNSKHRSVKSGSSMGNKADKNKHVWGK